MYIFKLKLSEKARGFCMYVFLVNFMDYARANGAKRRSGRKPGARVTNRA